jgi:glycosyltransferase involved in cell wall biosynthesis
MKEIKIKQIFGTHQIYQEIVNFPPEGIQYLGVSGETKKGEYYEKKKIKEFLSKILQTLKIPRIMHVKPGNYDLIHSSRGILPLQIFNKKPWVMDIEHVSSFTGLDMNTLKKKNVKKFIERKLSSKYCKAILCHCEATRQSFFKHLNCEKFKEKIKILYPSSHLIPLNKVKSKKIKILCLSSNFKGKAGFQTLKVFERLSEKYSKIEFIFKADVPEKLRRIYEIKNIKYVPYFNSIIPREKLLKDFYLKSDIFFYPTITDSFGYSLIDALVAKLPIVSTNLFAVPEIVKDKKNGFVVKIPDYKLEERYSQSFPYNKLKGKKEESFIKDLIKALSKLIENKKLRERMGKESFKLISEGKFSIKERNKKLKRIYEEALK